MWERFRSECKFSLGRNGPDEVSPFLLGSSTSTLLERKYALQAPRIHAESFQGLLPLDIREGRKYWNKNRANFIIDQHKCFEALLRWTQAKNGTHHDGAQAFDLLVRAGNMLARREASAFKYRPRVSLRMPCYSCQNPVCWLLTCCHCVSKSMLYIWVVSDMRQ